MDMSMPELNGIEATRQIRESHPHIRVIALSMHSDKRFLSQVFRAGAMGYIVKQDAIDNIAIALQETLNGRRYLSPGMAKQLQSNGLEEEPRSSHDLVPLLTDRELEIFELIGKGREVREISEALNVSPKTVETHRTNIKEKLKLKNSRQVARVALQWITEHPA